MLLLPLILGFSLLVMIAIIYWRESLPYAIERFEGKDDFSAVEAKLHDRVFSNEKLYQHDIEKIAEQVIKDKDYKGLKILDAGCGVGRHYKELVKTFKGAEVVGVDRSSNMLSQARLNNPDGDFLKGDLQNSDLFPADTFDYIFSMLDTLYHNEDHEKILRNYRKWLKPNGVLCIHIFDPEKLDPGALPQTQYYVDENNHRHGLTYYDGFAHDAYWKHDNDCIKYIQNYILDNGLKTTKKIKMYIPSKSATIKNIKSIGFKLVDVISLNELDIEDIELFCFRK